MCASDVKVSAQWTTYLCTNRQRAAAGNAKQLAVGGPSADQVRAAGGALLARQSCGMLMQVTACETPQTREQGQQCLFPATGGANIEFTMQDMSQGKLCHDAHVRLQIHCHWCTFEKECPA